MNVMKKRSMDWENDGAGTHILDSWCVKTNMRQMRVNFKGNSSWKALEVLVRILFWIWWEVIGGLWQRKKVMWLTFSKKHFGYYTVEQDGYQGMWSRLCSSLEYEGMRTGQFTLCFKRETIVFHDGLWMLDYQLNS